MVPGRIPVSSQRGFTMAELLVVIAVIGIIAVTANPTFNPLGTAGAGTITTQNVRGSSSRSVVVSSSGRIRIQ